MAAPLVGTVAADVTGAVGGAVTPTAGTGQSRTAGNLLVVAVLATGSATLPAAPSGWLVARQQAGTSCSASIFYRIATGADSLPTVVAITGATLNAIFYEFSGQGPGGPDKTGGGAVTSGSAVTATNPGVDVLVGELVFMCGGVAQSSAIVNATAHTPNNGVSASNTVNNGASTNVSHYNFAYGVTTGKTSADSDTMSTSSGSLTGAVLAIASFQLPNVLVTPTATAVAAASVTGPLVRRSYPPTLIGYDEIAYNSSSTPRPAQNGITWQANDMIVVIASNEGSGVLGAPTLSGVTFTALPGQNSGSTTFSMSVAWWARPSSGGSGFVNGSCGGTGIIWGLSVWVWRGSDGIGTSAVSASPGTATTVSLTPTDTHSALMWAATDWQGSAVGATVGTPTPTHTDESALEGGNYSEYVYDLVDLASIAPQSLGVSGNAGTGPWTVLGVEVLGSYTSSVPQLAPIASAGGAVVALVTAAAALAPTATAVSAATGAIAVLPAIVATGRATALATATVTAAAVSSFILDCV